MPMNEKQRPQPDLQAESDRGQQQPRRPRRVFLEQEQRAGVERRQRFAERVDAAAPTGVHDGGARTIHRAPSLSLQPAAEIGVFPVQEEVLVHAADLIERAAPDEHTGARHPVDVERLDPSVERRQVVPRQRIVREAARQPRAAAGNRGRQPWKPSCGALHAAVGVEDLGRHDGRICPRQHVRHRFADGIGAGNAIRIQQQEERRPRCPDPQVDAGGEALVRRSLDQHGPRKAAADF
jgi:hypothetical protein